MTTFTWRPTYGGQLSKQPKVAAAAYGDGYSQRAAIGINNNPETWTLTFEGRDAVEAAAIMAFLDAAGGVLSFTWVNMNGVTGLYTCGQYSQNFDDEDKNQIQAKFVQVFGG